MGGLQSAAGLKPTPHRIIENKVKKRLLYGSGVVLLSILVTLVVWQGSFNFGEYGPSGVEETYLIWALSTLIFILMVTLGFMLFRTGVKLYVERTSNREGSRIKTKLVLGALALCCMPVFFLVLFSIQVLNVNLMKWFSRPAQQIQLNLTRVSGAFEGETRRRVEAQARWLAALPETTAYAISGVRPARFTAALCAEAALAQAWLERAGSRLELCGVASAGKAITARAPVTGTTAVLVARGTMPADLGATQAAIEREIRDYDDLSRQRKETRWAYTLLLITISLFILFVAVWSALFMARQITGPIAALLEAASQARRGNLGYRVQTPAIDELATLVKAFNEMMRDLEATEGELERRRQFTETILESIPTGVISLSAEGKVLKVNRVLARILDADSAARASRLEDLFPADEVRQIRHLMNRARRLAAASTQIDLKTARQTLHLAVTVSALEGGRDAGFVVVLEDTSELLRAQKAAAWHEVARRIAHEMKNPLTPIALSAERIARQLERLDGGPAAPETVRILRECSATIATEVESMKTLVDEFSQFARFPAAQPVLSDLNEVVESALAVFAGRLDGIELRRQLASGLPAVEIDREQFKRVLVNLVDNACEAMRDSMVKRLLVATHAVASDLVELTVADTGCGVSSDTKEKLFLPYFSTKDRGTGLGLAIVHHILAEHGAQIRVEDNQPMGTRFVVEIPAAAPAEAEPRPVETHA